MSDVLKSVRLDYYILKSSYKAFVPLYVIAAVIGMLTRKPAITIAVVMIITAPFIGTYFSLYEKNNLNRLYGILPLGKLETVAGRYLYALLLGVVSGIIAGILATVFSLFTGNVMSYLDYLDYLSLSFLGFCLFISIVFPIYFKFPFSKVYILANLPLYLCGVIGLFIIRKTNFLKYVGLIVYYFSSHQYMIWILGFGLGLGLLFISFLLSYAVSSEIQKTDLPAGKPGRRLFFADNLRTALIVLVILHHLSVIYAANTPFYYLEPSKDITAIVLLILFQLFNQAYFMGFFFLLSGYFTPGSFDRKGPVSFLKNRLLRLGIPIIVFAFVLNPLTSIRIYQKPVSLTHMAMPFTWDQYFSRVRMGPVWFLVMLLVFDLCYWLWRLATKNREKKTAAGNDSLLTFRTMVIFILALALASYFIRIVLPFSKYVLGFPSLAYLPQYISFFLIGIAADRRNWLRKISDPLGALGFVLAAIATLTLFPGAIIGSGAAYLGGGTWQSAIYALWDSIFSVGVCLAALTFFRRFFDHQNKLSRFLSQHSFTVYIIHAPVIVFLALALRGVQIEQLLKFGLMAVVGVPLCFGVAYLVRKIPYAKRIL
ncbi:MULTISPECIES: acyltransferase family protein [unclassified Sporolactobacillus]|uniref:acyltransferase family protein n=1 Tax=unclassified Sporolactobacillus TaxID=2628533 RepID=UPI002367B908|nr:acyltransferase family protein [Sporolactobacillus sp. CQH2019]MDD9149803.1 acyltransferase family protein [Sporolactobacillus sp. CQH2019]